MVLGLQVVGDWKVNGQLGSLFVKDMVGKLGVYVLSVLLSVNEILLIVDVVSVFVVVKFVVFVGVVKGQFYLLGKDLIGVVNVVSFGGGKYCMNVVGEILLIVIVG